jgi:hypothetical protein
MELLQVLPKILERLLLWMVEKLEKTQFDNQNILQRQPMALERFISVHQLLMLVVGLSTNNNKLSGNGRGIRHGDVINQYQI